MRETLDEITIEREYIMDNNGNKIKIGEKLVQLKSFLLRKIGSINEMAGWIFLLGSVFLALSIIIVFRFMFDDVYFNTSGNIDPNLASQFGAFIGGFASPFIAMASSLFLISTIVFQLNTNSKNQLENVIYKQLDYHKSNAGKLFIDALSSQHEQLFGVQALNIMVKKFNIIYELVCSNKSFIKNEFCVEERDLIDIAYKLFFFGFTQESIDTLRKEISSYFNDFDAFIDKISFNTPDVSYGGKNYSVLRSLELQLGQYYRNLYSLVKTVDSASILNSEDKQTYMKLIRTQLSTPEIWLLFLNSISKLGQNWNSNDYIKKYELIKNIPYKYSNLIDHEKYYQINYEYNER